MGTESSCFIYNYILTFLFYIPKNKSLGQIIQTGCVKVLGKHRQIWVFYEVNNNGHQSPQMTKENSKFGSFIWSRLK